jgi:oligopeptide transport system permease protein
VNQHLYSSPPPSSVDPGSTPEQRYAALLEEARGIQGISLWHDAWRRLKRNGVAMVSLGLLILVALLSFATPLLPLQSPIVQDVQQRIFQPPNLDSYALYLEQAGGERQPLTEALAEFDQRIEALYAEAAELQGSQREARLKQIEEIAAQGNPMADVWWQPGPVTRWAIRLRLAVFGNWCIPSLCGCDDLGRDLLARLFWGARVSLIVGIVATLVSLVIGVSYGAISGYVGGTVDAAMMRIVDILYSVPFIFVVIFIMTILSEDSVKRQLTQAGIDQIMIFYLIIGAIYWLTMSRVVRGQVISLRNEQFIDAARTIGASTARIVFRHIVPNVMGVVIVYLTLTIPAVMLFEAFLSFLGIGVQPPDVSWGLLVNNGVQVITPIKVYWWLVLFPGLALSLTLFSLNFLGDGLRDALDPRMKNR